MPKVLEITNLSFSFYDKPLFREASFSMERGELWGLVGANGHGKSTLIDLIMGIRPYEHGAIKVLGLPVGDDQRKFLAHTILLSQSYCIPNDLSANEIFHLFELAYPKFSPTLLRRLVSLFEIDGQQKLHRMSEGFKKRVHFAAAVAARPKLLILDEITALIDEEGRTKIFDLLKNLNKKEGVSALVASNISEDFRRHKIPTVKISNHQLKEAA